MARSEFPTFNIPEYDDRETFLRPKRVAAARQRQPLLKLLKDSGIGTLIEEKAEVSLPELVIVNRPLGGVGFAEAYPKEDDVDVDRAISESQRRSLSPLAEGRWTIDVYPRPNADMQFNTTLRMEIWKHRRRGSEEGIWNVNMHTIILELAEDKNLRVVGSQEYFSGTIDHLNKRGLNRIKAALNRAFKKPAIRAASIGIMAQSA